MAGRRNEIYQPDSAPQYDPLEPDDEDFASHPLPRLIVVTLLGLAGLAITIWLGYARGVDRGTGDLVVIGPPPGPVRTRPEIASAAPQPYSGLKIYEQPRTAEAEAQPSQLSPVRGDQTLLASANPTSGVSPESPPKARVTRSEGKQQAPEYLQIGSYPTQELADKAFRQFRIAHGDLAGDLLPDIKKADLGGKGIWYRLRIGPFAGKAIANETCDKMKKVGVTCLIATR